MHFTPLTEEELQVSMLLPEGTYNYKVIKSEDRMSNAGNEYTAITLKITDSNGQAHMVFTNMALIKLLKHFCDVNGLQDEYKSGNLPAELFMYKSGGRVILGVEGEKPDGKGGIYKAKNIVKDYVQDATPSALNPLPGKDEFESDELPF